MLVRILVIGCTIRICAFGTDIVNMIVIMFAFDAVGMAVPVAGENYHWMCCGDWRVVLV